MASKRRLRRKAQRLCGRKNPYDSKTAAVRKLVWLMNQPGFDISYDTHAYHCPTCHRWHIGRYRRREGQGG